VSAFRKIRGFEDVWRAPIGRPVRPETGAARPQAVRARLARIAARAPEVMVKVTGRTRDPAHLAAHLDYITRKGALEAQDRDGCTVAGRREVAELAEDWAAAQPLCRRRRANSPLSVALVLSMPAGVDPLRLRDAAADFARTTFAERLDYVAVLHTDAGHPHVHLTVRALGDDRQRLNPKKADLEAWRQGFAQALRDHGVEAEATPRRARGVTRKAERTPMRKLRERFEAGQGPMPERRRRAFVEAGAVAFGAPEATAWEQRLAAQQRRIRSLYLAQARLLQASPEASDQQLGRQVEAFVAGMPAPDTQRLALARALRETNAELGRAADRSR
jgi:hypothetical protein